MEWGWGSFEEKLKKELVLRIATVCEGDELQSEKKMLKGVYVMWKNKPFFFLQKLRFSKAVKNMV
jgi:hypothetical protein